MWQFRCRNRNRNRYSVSLYIYYNSILCLYILIPADLFTGWGIDLFSPPGSVLPVFSVRGSIYWSPDRFRGARIPRDTGVTGQNIAPAELYTGILWPKPIYTPGRDCIMAYTNSCPSGQIIPHEYQNHARTS